MSMSASHHRFRLPSAVSRDPLLFLLVAAGLVSCGLLLQPFIAALTGLGLIALLTRSPLRSVRRKVRNRTLVATVSVVCVTLCIIAPAALAIQCLAQRILSALSLLNTAGAADRFYGGFNALQSWLARYSISIGDFDLNSTLSRASGPIGSTVMSVLGGSVATATQLVLMLFLLFFWYRSGDAFVSRVRLLMPFSPAERRFLGAAMVRAVRAVVIGRVVVAAIQAVMAWITFLALRVPGASLLATVTFVCCILPAVGAFFVWVPVLVYLLLIEAWTRAIILGLVGTFILSTVDNVLQAIIAGNQARLGTVEILLSILGGVSLLGISGLVLGPLIWVTAGGLLVIWNKRQRRSLSTGIAV
jgi:predicted PurR-regulated permease PerM